MTAAGGASGPRAVGGLDLPGPAAARALRAAHAGGVPGRVATATLAAGQRLLAVLAAPQPILAAPPSPSRPTGVDDALTAALDRLGTPAPQPGRATPAVSASLLERTRRGAPSAAAPTTSVATTSAAGSRWSSGEATGRHDPRPTGGTDSGAVETTDGAARGARDLGDRTVPGRRGRSPRPAGRDAHDAGPPRPARPPGRAGHVPRGIAVDGEVDGEIGASRLSSPAPHGRDPTAAGGPPGSSASSGDGRHGDDTTDGSRPRSQLARLARFAGSAASEHDVDDGARPPASGRPAPGDVATGDGGQDPAVPRPPGAPTAPRDRGDRRRAARAGSFALAWDDLDVARDGTAILAEHDHRVDGLLLDDDRFGFASMLDDLLTREAERHCLSEELA